MAGFSDFVKSRPHLIPCLVAAAMLLGCNPYTKYYMHLSNTEAAVARPQSNPSLRPIMGDPVSDLKAMEKKGYVVLGCSDFIARRASDKQAVAHARKIGADVVAVSSQYVGTISGVRTYNIPNPDQQINTYHSGGIYTDGGYVPYSGYSTSTVPGGYSTRHVPYSYTMYEYWAIYYKKASTTTRPAADEVVAAK